MTTRRVDPVRRAGRGARRARAAALAGGWCSGPGLAQGIDACQVFDLRSTVTATDDGRSFCDDVDDGAESGTVDDTAARPALADMDSAQAGADFWLTPGAARHGVLCGLGRAGDCLADAARTFGEGGLDITDGNATLA